MKPKTLFIGLFLLLLAASCASKKKLVTPTNQAAGWEWMTAKMLMDVTAPDMELKNISGMLRMHRDSTVWISASAVMGIESVRALVTQDTVIVINRIEQTYITEPLSMVADKLNIPPTVQEYQTLLLGNGEQAEVRLGPFTANIRYSDIQWDVPTTFPVKINKKYERKKL